MPTMPMTNSPTDRCPKIRDVHRVCGAVENGRMSSLLSEMAPQGSADGRFPADRIDEDLVVVAPNRARPSSGSTRGSTKMSALCPSSEASVK